MARGYAQVPAAGPTGSGDSEDYGPGGARGWLLFSLLATALFLMNGSYSVTLTVLPDISHDLDSSTNAAVWVTLGTMLASTATMPAAGMLSDVFGHKEVWMVGMAIRIITQVLAGISPSMPLLILSRVVSGFGGALDGPSGSALVIRAFPAHRKPFLVGLMNGVGTISQTLGLLVGGLVAESFGWRMLFLAPVPILVAVQAGVALLLRGGEPEVPRALHSPGSTRDGSDPDGSAAPAEGAKAGDLSWLAGGYAGKLRGFDWVGTSCYMGGMTFMLLAVNFGSVAGLCCSPPAVFALIASFLAIVLFAGLYRVEKRARAPIIPFGLLADPRLSGALVGNVLLWLPYIAAWLNLPLELRNIDGLSASRTTVLLIIRPCFNAAFGGVSGHFLGRGASTRTTLMVGAILNVPSYVLFVIVSHRIRDPSDVGSNVALLQITLALMGAGLGLCYNALTIFVTDQVPDHRLANALGMVRMGQDLAGMVGQTLIAGIVTKHPDRPGPYASGAQLCLWLGILFFLFPVWLCGLTQGMELERRAKSKIAEDTGECEGGVVAEVASPLKVFAEQEGPPPFSSSSSSIVATIQVSGALGEDEEVAL